MGLEELVLVQVRQWEEACPFVCYKVLQTFLPWLQSIADLSLCSGGLPVC